MECDINGMREGTSQKLSPEFSSGPGGNSPSHRVEGAMEGLLNPLAVSSFLWIN